MKKMKKMLAMLLAVVMTMAMAVTTFAAPETKASSTGQLIINNTKAKGNIEAYRMFSLDNVDYTLETKFEEFFKTEYPTDMGQSAGEELSSKAFEKVKAIQEGDVPGKVAFSKKVLTWVKEKEQAILFDDVKTTATATATSTTLNLPYGFYMIYTPSAKAQLEAGNVKTPAMMVTVSKEPKTVNLKSEYPTVDKNMVPGIVDPDDVTAKPNEGGSLDVTLNQGWDQNHDMGIDAITPKFKAADYKVGDIITFKLTAKVPDMTGFTDYTFKLHDTLSKGLTFKAIQKVAVGNTAIEPVPVEEEKNNSYTLAVDTIKANPATKLTITLNNFFKSYRDRVGDTIEVYYKAVLNKDAVIGMNPNTNKAEVEYSTDPNNSATTDTSEPDIVEVHTFGFDLFKFYTDAAQPIGLAGAEFGLYSVQACSEDSKIKLTKQVDEKTWVVTEDQTSGQDDPIVTPTGGKVVIKGLSEGTYYLKETKAPDGYHKLKTPIKITITPKYDQDTGKLTSFSIDYEIDGKVVTGTEITSKDPTVTIKVENKKGTLLPETGGMGTVLFTVVAIVLILGVAISFVVSRRKEK